ncbi:serine threonine kinase [Fusarium pseudocircinatum]|uniref:non-specific serine/threonine protein kinase n=1 Tax=Fusarium pseudocircinatum TaxID=56676 RepID=A0A8H5KND1_9HYPO|nr:serine threonine kinase [Fusarium pseudocircinatum]
MAKPDYTEICRDIRSQFTVKFKKAKTKDKFATRGMVRDILSRPILEMLYESIYDDGPDAVNAYRFVRSIERKMLHDFLAVLLYAKCSIDAAKAFTNELIFGNMAEEQQQYSETPYLLPATEEYLKNLFDPFDAQEIFAEQQPFCTIVLGGPGVVTIDQDDKRSLPWLDEKHIGSGAFGSVYEVKIPKDHLTMHRDFTQTIRTSKLVARKDYKPAKDIEESFEKEVTSIREIFSGNSKHINILESFGTIIIRGPEQKFSLLMPLAEMDLQKYMEKYPDISADSRWDRERIISAAIGLADGLDFLHSKMTTPGGDRLVCYHMDLKPSNILVFLHDPRTEGTDTEDRDYGMIWKLSDFGLSRVKTKTKPEKNLDSLFERKLIDQSSQASPTQNNRGNGTYLPSEAQDQGKTMDHKSDIWSLGCIISVLFTYIEQGHLGLKPYSESRLKYSNKKSAIKFDVFYQENRSSRAAHLNEAVKIQHDRLIEAAKKRNEAEGEAVSSVLRFLESSVLVIDQSNRCNAESIVQCLGKTLKKYQTVETAVGPASPPEKPYPLRQKLKNVLTNGFHKERSIGPLDIHRWRLDIENSTRFKDCRSSPDGRLIAFWSDKAIMVFDRATTISRMNSSSKFGTGLRATSTESVRDRALRNVGTHRLAGVSCSWKSLGLTNSYLVAATTETKSLECYVFDIALDQTLRTYSKISLPHSGFHSLMVSPNQNAMACILSNNDRASLFTAVIETNLSEPTTPSASNFSEASSRQEYQDAGITLARQKLLDLDCSISSVEHIALRTKDEGYIILRSAATLFLCLFTIRPPRLVKQKLKLGSPTSSALRLFTDMVCIPSEANEGQSEVIVVAQAQRIFHLKFRGANEAASSVAYLPIEQYRILKIATNGQVVVALGAHSGSSHLFLLEVKLSNPRVRPQLQKIAELKEVSTSCQAKLSVIGDWNEPIALITTATPDGQYRVYHKGLSSLANNTS